MEKIRQEKVRIVERKAYYTVLFLFFLSGAAQLVYEITWMRILKVSFGSTTFAVSTILASFMAGVGIGSVYFGKKADRSSDPLRIYVYLEAGIGLFALFSFFVFYRLEHIYLIIYSLFNPLLYPSKLIRFLFSFCVLILPTTLIGGTFPVVSKFLVKTSKTAGVDIGNLYSINTFGAVLGAICTGFFFLHNLGIKESLLIAAGTNFSIAYFINQLRKKANRDNLQQYKLEFRSEGIKPQGTLSYAILIIGGVEGFCAFAYQVLWTRVLMFLLGSSVYAFTIILVTFLTGIALGSFLITKLLDRRKNLLNLLAFIQVFIGFFAIFSVFLLRQVGSPLDKLFIYLGTSAWMNKITVEFVGCFLIMLVPTVFMGATFPLLGKLLSRSFKQLGYRLGSLYFFNTFGGIVGSSLTGFALIPFLGIQKSIFIVAAFNISIAAIIQFLNTRTIKAKKPIIFTITGGIAFSLLVLVFPHNYFYAIYQRPEQGSKIIYCREGVTSTVTVHEYPDSTRVMDINGINVAGTNFQLRSTQQMQGHLPLLLHPQPESILHIGFGSGATCWAMTRHDTVKHITAVEISPEVIKASNYFLCINHSVLSDARVDLIIDDARNYLLKNPDKYNIISSDVIHPLIADNSLLFSKEYFKLCKSRLSKDGIMSFWLPMYQLSNRDYKIILRTFHEVFPYVTVWYINSHLNPYTIVVGRREPFRIDFVQLNRRLHSKGIESELRNIRMANSYRLLSCFIMDQGRLAEFYGKCPINTDDHPYLEFSAPMSLQRKETWHSNLLNIYNYRMNASSLLINFTCSDQQKRKIQNELEIYFGSSQHVMKGHIFLLEDELKQAMQQYRQALELTPENDNITHLIKDVKTEIKYTYIRKVKNFYKDGMFDRAIQLCREALEIDPAFVEFHYYLGLLFIKKGMYDQARDHLVATLELRPNLESVRFLLRKLQKLGY